MSLLINAVKVFFIMSATSFVFLLAINVYINRKTALNNFSNSLCCIVHLCVFFYCTVYLHRLPRSNRIPTEHRERIVRAFEDDAEDYLLVEHRLGVMYSRSIH